MEKGFDLAGGARRWPRFGMLLTAVVLLCMLPFALSAQKVVPSNDLESAIAQLIRQATFPSVRDVESFLQVTVDKEPATDNSGARSKTYRVRKNKWGIQWIRATDPQSGASQMLVVTLDGSSCATPKAIATIAGLKFNRMALPGNDGGPGGWVISGLITYRRFLTFYTDNENACVGRLDLSELPG